MQLMDNDEFDEDFDDDLGDDDFGFIIGPNGELKSIIFPDHPIPNPPDAIRKILKIFKIDIPTNGIC